MSELKDDFHPVVLFEGNDPEQPDLFDLQELKKSEGGVNIGPLVEKVVDRDLAEFAEFMRSISSEGLAHPELAILKTYLAWKLGLGTEEEQDAG